MKEAANDSKADSEWRQFFSVFLKAIWPSMKKIFRLKIQMGKLC
jgi:hypothetical protein